MTGSKVWTDKLRDEEITLLGQQCYLSLENKSSRQAPSLWYGSRVPKIKEQCAPKEPATEAGRRR